MSRSTTLVLLVAACIADAGAATYKCKDAAGRTTYSEQPCPDAKSQQRIKTESDGTATFVEQIHAIALHGNLADVAFFRGTLGVTLSEQQQGVNHIYGIAATPPGSPIQRGRLQTPIGGETWNYASYAEFGLDARRCVSPEMLSGVLGPGGLFASTQHNSYFVKGTGPYIIEVRVTFSARAPHCAQQIQLVRGDATSRKPAAR